MYPVVLCHNVVVLPIKRKIQSNRTIKQLCTENHHLLSTVEDLRANVVTLSAQLMHSQETQELLEFKSRYETEHMVLAHIIQRHISRDSHYILIDAGADKGIDKDMVAVYKNCLVGRVVQVYQHYSKIMLLTDKNCKVSAVCCATNVHGIHEGCNRTKTKLAHVSHLLQLQDQDLILSSGEGLVFPKGFGLGYIQKFELNGIEYAVTVAPLFDIHCIDYCFVIKKMNT
jgi:rod shape-determining protein MreC